MNTHGVKVETAEQVLPSCVRPQKQTNSLFHSTRVIKIEAALSLAETTSAAICGRTESASVAIA